MLTNAEKKLIIEYITGDGQSKGISENPQIGEGRSQEFWDDDVQYRKWRDSVDNFISQCREILVTSLP